MTMEYEEIRDIDAKISQYNDKEDHQDDGTRHYQEQEAAGQGRQEDKILTQLVNEEVFDDIPQMTLEPGKHYHGSFWINEHGEIHVQPERTGTNPNGMSKHSSGDNYVIYSSKNLVRVVISLPRIDKQSMKALYNQAVIEAMIELFRHEWQQPQKNKKKK